MPAAHQPPVTDLLFVYGTLMQRYTNTYARQLHQKSRLIGLGQLSGQLYKVSWYPAAVPDPTAKTLIFGEVYQLLNPDEILPILDAYEEAAESPDYPEGSGIFVRKTVSVQVTEQLMTCWMYSYNASTAKLVPIESGRWVNER